VFRIECAFEGAARCCLRGCQIGQTFRKSSVKLAEVARHYLTRALEASNGNKVEAAKLVGLSSYQTFTNWVARYGINHVPER
jgi:DNA-binding NtrC family response regulator